MDIGLLLKMCKSNYKNAKILPDTPELYSLKMFQESFK
jgi:hypothetical protein